MNAGAVRVLGEGLAGLACARVLARLGRRVRVVAGPRGAAPVLLLNDIARDILVDLFPELAATLDAAHPITAREVCWDGGTYRRLDLDRPSLAVDAARLAEHMRAGLAADPGVELGACEQGDAGDWTLVASGRAAGRDVPVLRAGERRLACMRVRLRADADPHACVMRRLAGGSWVFLFPTSAEEGIAQLMLAGRTPGGAATVQRTLRVDADLPWRERLGAEVVFDAAPRLARQPAAGRRLLLGDAAMAHDPICGDGTGQALRGAVHVAALTALVDSGEPEALAFRHYAARLRRSFLAHLRACRDLYATSADLASGWREELTSTDQAIEDLEHVVAGDGPALRYRLNGFTLEPMQARRASK